MKIRLPSKSDLINKHALFGIGASILLIILISMQGYQYFIKSQIVVREPLNKIIQSMKKDPDQWKTEQDFSFLMRDVKNKKIAALAYNLPNVIYVSTTDGQKYQVADRFGQFSIALTNEYVKENMTFPTAYIGQKYGESSWWAANILNLIIIFVVLGMVLHNRFGRYRNVSIPTTKFKDVIGASEAKGQLIEMLTFYKDGNKYKAMGSKPPRGILLFGAPGVGKTLLARALAGESKMNFIAVTGSEFSSKFIGMGVQRVKGLFKTAKRKSPCIIFIDEIDGLGKRNDAENGSGVTTENNRIINQFLSEMDGFNTDNEVIVIAATNFQHQLDPAMLREGRFDRKISVQLPSIDERIELYEYYLSKLQINENIDIAQIARMSVGMSPAAIENVTNQAGLIAIKKDFEKIETGHLIQAIEVVRIGEARPLPSSALPEDIKRVAVHEAGHAVIAELLGVGCLEKVTILPHGEALGFTMITQIRDESNYTKNMLESQIKMLLGGRAAEKLCLTDISSGASNDLKEASNIAYQMVSMYGMDEANLVSVAAMHPGASLDIYWERANTLLQSLHQTTLQLLSSNKEALMKVANELVVKETVSGEFVRTVLEERKYH